MRVLLASLLLTGLLALATNAMIAWLLLGVAALAFAGFCGLWAWARAMQAERDEKVRALPRHVRELELQRAASS